MKLDYVTLSERWKHGEFNQGAEVYRYDKCNFILAGRSILGIEYFKGFHDVESAKKEILKIKKKYPCVRIYIELENSKDALCEDYESLIKKERVEDGN